MIRLFKYQKLFGAEIMHKYYRSLRSADFTVVPSKSCEQLMRRYGLVFRATAYGFDIFGETGNNGKLKKAVTASLKFTFYIRLNNPGVENFSDLPLERNQSEKFYFNNLQVNQVKVFGLGTTELLINKGGQVSAADLKKIVFNHYSFSFISAGGSKVFKLFQEDDNGLAAQKTIIPVNGSFTYQHTLDELVSGLYRLEADAVVVDRFYLDREAEISASFGVIEIFTNVPASNRFINNGDEISYKNYKIAFMNRSTKWRYKVINNSGISMPNPAIAIGNDTGKFTQAEPLVFVSNNTMELKEEPVTGIRVLKNKSNTLSEVRGNLANAGIDSIIPVKTNGAYTVYSDIFIYL